MAPSLLALLPVLCAMWGAAQGVGVYTGLYPWTGYLGYNNGYNPHNDQNNLNKRVGELENKMDAMQFLMQGMASQECQSGVVGGTMCPTDGSVTGPFRYPCLNLTMEGEFVFATLPVTFPRAFMEPPVVTLGLTGLMFFLAKNCSLAVADKTATGFNIDIVAQDLTLTSFQLQWMACPRALQPPAASLTGASMAGSNDGMDSVQNAMEEGRGLSEFLRERTNANSGAMGDNNGNMYMTGNMAGGDTQTGMSAGNTRFTNEVEIPAEWLQNREPLVEDDRAMAEGQNGMTGLVRSSMTGSGMTGSAMAGSGSGQNTAGQGGLREFLMSRGAYPGVNYN